MRTSKSPKAVLQVAHLIGWAALPVIRIASVRRSSRGRNCCLLGAQGVFAARLSQAARRLLLGLSRSWLPMIGLKSVPHYTTFQKGGCRLLHLRSQAAIARRDVECSAQESAAFRVYLAAGDGTGWESHHVSQLLRQATRHCSKFWQKDDLQDVSQSGRAVRHRQVI